MTLEEYLIKLGWSIDEPGFKKFMGAVSASGARVAELGGVAVETAAAVEAMVARVARSYETLYYASQRTGQSVKYIQSTQFAFKQIGLSAEEANSSIEGIAATLRTQPWLKAIFGGATTPQQIATNLGKSGLPYFLQAKFAEMIGMSEKTLLHLQKFGAEEAKFQADFARRQKEAGIDPEKLSKQSVAFGRALNTLESDLEIWGERFAVNWIEPITRGITVLDEVVQWLNRADNATHGWLSTLEALAGTAGALWILEKVLKRIGVAMGLSAATAVAAPAAGAVAGGALAGGGGAAGTAAAVAGGSLALPLTAAVGTLAAAYWANKKYGVAFGANKLDGAQGAPVGNDNNSKAARIDQAVTFFRNNGFSDNAAIGIASGLFSESALDPNAINPTSGAKGIGQWLGTRKTGLQQKYGQNSTFEQQLEYVLQELRNNEKATGNLLLGGKLTPSGAAGAFIHGFERPGPAGEISDMRTAAPLAESLAGLLPQQSGDTTKTVTLHSKTDVHVAGNASMETVQGFKTAVNDANANNIRNLSAVTR